MATLALSHEVAFPIRHVYAVVADIERYPEFVPGFIAVRTEGYRDGKLVVLQRLGMKGVRQTVRTFASFDPPHRIHITTATWPFRILDQTWTFADPAPNRTQVMLSVTYEFANPVIGVLGEEIFSRIIEKSVDAFKKRLRTIPVPC